MQSILAETKYQEPYKNKTEENLVLRYNDISKFIDDKNLSSEEIKAFTFYFLERLVVIELSIEKDDTPMVFEVINDRGESLKPFEILKGKMIGALGKNDNEGEFEDKRNLLGGLLLLKGLDNISSGNEEYVNKLKTYSRGLIWGHSLCADFYHANKDFVNFNCSL